MKIAGKIRLSLSTGFAAMPLAAAPRSRREAIWGASTSKIAGSVQYEHKNSNVTLTRHPVLAVN
jgi:hypothetical protein